MKSSPEHKQRRNKKESSGAGSKQKTSMAGARLDPNVAGLLCYVGVWITGIAFLIIEQKNRFVRFHALQSIIVFGALAIIGSLLGRIPFIGWFLAVIIGVGSFVLWILLMTKAYQGQLYGVPVAHDLAEKALEALEKGVVEISEQHKDPKGATATAVPSREKPRAEETQAGVTADEYFKSARGERIASSSFAIAWSVILLIFFNLFNKYLAYYHYEHGEWARYPILTANVYAWLPLLTTTLILTIIGHIILIIFDKYVLRQTTIIVLNLFGIAVAATLLYIFPFDFNSIPNSAAAAVGPIVAALVLIGIIIGLAIATIVRFIKLIVNIVKGTSRY